jgi:hypothetical protein
MDTPSAIELANTEKVLDILVGIEGISYSNQREDIFLISGPDGAKCILDVEETMVCIGAEICDIPTDETKQLPIFKSLLELNNDAIHGKFTIFNNKLFFKENLEIENLDDNELEAALGWTLSMVLKGAEIIASIIE